MHSLKGLMDVRCLKLQGGILSRPCRFPCWKLWNLKDSGLEGICPVLWAEVLLDQPSRVKGEAVKILSPFTIIFIKLPDSSVGKESACSTGDPGSIPGLGRSLGEGIGCPLQYLWASLVAQLVKNPPVMRETWVRSLGWEDPLKKGKVTHSSILAWRILWTV